MDVRTKFDTKHNIERISTILSSDIFDSKNIQHPLRGSAFIELMICMRDLLSKTEKHAKRIDFCEDIVVNSYVKDVTDAVTALRDACCHIDSFKRNFNVVGIHGAHGAFNSIAGKGTLMQIGDLKLTSDYDDDVAFFYGTNRLYLKRHIIRAFEEANLLLRDQLQ